MPKKAQPFFRKFDGWWYVNLKIGGKRKQVKLAKGRKAREAAFERFHELMARAASVKRAPGLARPSPLNPIETVCGVLEAFLDHAATNVSPATFVWYQRYLGQFAEHVGTELAAKDLLVHHVTKWLDETPAWGSSSRGAAICSVRRAFRWAAEQGLAPFTLIGLRAPAKKTREKILDDAEYAALLAAVKDSRFHDLLTFLWNTGARPQEASKADVEHFEKKHKRIVFPTSQAKGKKVPRAIYLNAAALEVVDRLAKKYGTGPIFRNSRGKRWTRNAVRLRFARLKKALGERYCAYNLRHSFATNALSSGMDSVTASVLMGHSDASTLARIYQHLAQKPQVLSEAAEKAR